MYGTAEERKFIYIGRRNNMGSGGAREGAGRPSKRKGQKVVSVRMMPEYHKRLDELAKENGVSIGRMIELLIDSAQ